MTLDDKELMGRYIYQVIRRLSRAQMDEVRMELEELISDMYADKGSMETVLTQLGDPAEFAKQYQNDRQYLIGRDLNLHCGPNFGRFPYSCFWSGRCFYFAKRCAHYNPCDC